MKNIYQKISQVIFIAAIIAIGFISTAYAQAVSAQTVKRAETRNFSKNPAANIAQILNRRAKNRGAIVSAEDRAQFDLGYAFVRAMYYASAADNDKEARNSAIVELVYLIERLEGQPEAARLQKVLKSIVRQTGFGAERWNEIEQISFVYNAKIKENERWFFDFGMTMTRLVLATYFHDCDKIAKGLQKLQLLAKIAPKNLPAELIEPIKSLETYAAQNSFDDKEFMTIDNAVGGLMQTVLA